jgi:hypothetical protein
MRCWTAYQNTIQENQRLNFAFMNYLQDEMAFVVGLPRIGPRVRVPMPTYIDKAPITMNTTNNIQVEAGSQVGQINAGALVYLNKAVTAFNKTGQPDVADALRSFTQQVVDSKNLKSEDQQQILDLLRALVSEIAKPKAERNPSVFRLALQTIGPLVSAASAIATHWDHLKQLLEHLVL